MSKIELSLQAVSMEEREAALRSFPLLASISDGRLTDLAQRCRPFLYDGGEPVFDQGTTAGDLFFIIEGAVQLRATSGNGLDDTAPTFHLKTLGSNELVSDIVLLDLLIGSLIRRPHQCSAITVAHAKLLRVPQVEFLSLLKEDQALCERTADLIAKRFEDTQRLVRGISSMKSNSKVQTAAYLLEQFALAGTIRHGKRVLPRVTAAGLAQALGMTSRQAGLNLDFFRDFGTIQEDGEKRLVLLSEERLQRIIRNDPGADPHNDLDAWIKDIKQSLVMDGDIGWAQTLAKEAQGYFPEDDTIKYLGILAALRSGNLDLAKERLDSAKFETQDEDKACLQPRLYKERAFRSGSEETARSYARLSAEGYEAAYEDARTSGRAGFYPGINAAAMHVIAGNKTKGKPLAKAVLAALPPGIIRDYWAAITRVEALALLGEFPKAVAELKASLGQPGADVGSIGSTRKQFTRLAKVTCEPGWHDLLAQLNASPSLVIPSGPPPSDEFDDGMRERFRQILDLCRPEAVYLGGLAAGTTILAAEHLGNLAESVRPEHLRKLGTTPFAILPEPAEAYRTRKIVRDWRRRFDAVQQKAAMRFLRRDRIPAEHPSAWDRHANRHALGIAIAESRAQDKDCCLMPDPEQADLKRFHVGATIAADELPEWAKPGAVPAGFCILLLIRMMDDGPTVSVPAGSPGLVREKAVDPGILAEFGTVGNAVDAAFLLMSNLAEMKRSAQLLLDYSGLDGNDLARAPLLHGRLPSLVDNQINATNGFVGELALSGIEGIDYHPVSSTRVDRNLYRALNWVLHRMYL